MPIGEWTSFMNRLVDIERKALRGDLRSFKSRCLAKVSFFYDSADCCSFEDCE